MVSHYIAQCLYARDDDRDEDKKEKTKVEKNTFFHKKKGAKLTSARNGT